MGINHTCLANAKQQLGKQSLLGKNLVAVNTSTVTLRVVGGDEKGSLKSETVKYSRKSQGTMTEKDCTGKG
jgi:hypothetical protein